MQGCGRAVKTRRNRNDWRLLIGVPTPRYGAIIIVSRRFVTPSVGSRFFPVFSSALLHQPSTISNTPYPPFHVVVLRAASPPSHPPSRFSFSLILYHIRARKIGAKYCTTVRHNLISIKFYDCAEPRRRRPRSFLM